MARRTRRYQPSTPDELEGRLVLAGGFRSSFALAMLRNPQVNAGRANVGFAPRNFQRAPSRAAQVPRLGQISFETTVNQAYESFTNDFAVARSAFYAGLADPGNGNAVDTVNAFRGYTDQRVDVLAQEVLSSFLQSRASASRVVSGGVDGQIRALVARNINGTGDSSLLTSLHNSISQVATAPTPTVSLYTLTQDDAIEASRVAVVNGIQIVKVGNAGGRNSRFF